MKSNKRGDEILSRINQLERILNRGFALVRKNLTINKEHHFFLRHGLEGYKHKVQGEAISLKSFEVKEKYHVKVRQDHSLKHPHRKILEFLIEQYDYQKQVFKEFTFSALVKECRLGKNKAKEYFDFLLEKRYLEKRSDGYRVWYRVRRE